MLEVKHISFAYTEAVRVLEEVSFTIPSGEFLAIGGRNGSGKTTLTRILVGLETPLEGEIFHKGQAITNVSPAQRGRYIGYVFQQPDRQMFRSTVAEEVAFGPEQLGFAPEDVQKITAEVLEKVGLSDVAQEYPLNLRRGLKQRIAIASALAMKSSILILDEPTSGQDGKETQELLTILKTLHEEGITIILVTHDMDIIGEYCTRAIIMDKGHIAFDGTPQELFTICDDLYALGLDKPASVQLAEQIPGMGYCGSMRDFEEKMASLKGYANRVENEQEGGEDDE